MEAAGNAQRRRSHAAPQTHQDQAPCHPPAHERKHFGEQGVAVAGKAAALGGQRGAPPEVAHEVCSKGEGWYEGAEGGELKGQQQQRQHSQQPRGIPG